MTITPPTHYHILNLPPPSSSSSQSSHLSKQDLKLAYHRALLRYHPDKSSASSTRVKSSTTASTSTSSTGGGGAAANGSLHSSGGSNSRIYTIDEITTAYKTLSDPSARAEYDRDLRLSRATGDDDSSVKAGNGGGDEVFHTGLETVDLEDLGYVGNDNGDDGGGDGGEGYWFRSCRCGDEKGFFVTEGDLEREIESGEILVGCKGCSLWLRVLFAVVDGEEDGEEGVS